MLAEECEDRCIMVDGRCSDYCENLMSRHECREWDHCAWLFWRYTGDDGKCVLKSGTNYTCSDIKRYGECYDGGKMGVLVNQCEYYKGRCLKRCELYLDKEKCVKDGADYCMWLRSETEGDAIGRCILKVCH
jgi:hypothetical protein